MWNMVELKDTSWTHSPKMFKNEEGTYVSEETRERQKRNVDAKSPG